MREKIINDDNLTRQNITQTIVRGKILLVNSKNQILLGLCNNRYQFLGGHLEAGESLVGCLERELLEEAGIELKLKDIKPFYVLKRYSKDYPAKEENSLYEIYYFYIKTDIPFDMNRTSYTNNEAAGKFELKYIDLEIIEDVLTKNIPLDKGNAIIVPEMLSAIAAYKENITKKKD